jgi:hypothetical protein
MDYTYTNFDDFFNMEFSPITLLSVYDDKNILKRSLNLWTIVTQTPLSCRYRRHRDWRVRLCDCQRPLPHDQLRDGHKRKVCHQGEKEGDDR